MDVQLALTFEDVINEAKWLNAFRPPTYDKLPCEKITYIRNIPLCNGHLYGATRTAWVPTGLWKYDGTVYSTFCCFFLFGTWDGNSRDWDA